MGKKTPIDPPKPAYKQMKLPIFWQTNTSTNFSSSPSTSWGLPLAQTPLHLPTAVQQQGFKFSNKTKADYNNFTERDKYIKKFVDHLGSMSSPSTRQQPQREVEQHQQISTVNTQGTLGDQSQPQTANTLMSTSTFSQTKQRSRDGENEQHASNKRARVALITKKKKISLDLEYENMTLDEGMELSSNDGDSETGDHPLLLNNLSGPTKTLIPIHASKSNPAIVTIISQKGFTGKVGPSVESTIPNHAQVFESFIDNMFENPHPPMSRQVFYEMCSYVCEAGDSESLFKTVSKSLYANAQKVCDKLGDLASTNVNFLAELISQWQQFQAVLLELNETLSKINFHYIIKETKFLSLLDFGRNLCSDTISKDIKIQKRTVSSLIHLINRQRSKQPVDQHLLTTVLELIYKNLPTFRTNFEQMLVETTRSFYYERAHTGIKTMAVPSYIVYAITLILSEPTLANEYQLYIPQYITPGSSIAIDELLIKQLDTIFHKGLRDFIDPDRRPLLKSLYRLVAQSDKSSIFQKVFGQHIKNECNTIFKSTNIRGRSKTLDQTEVSLSFVTSLITLKKTMNCLLKDCFDGDPSFAHILKESFEVAINMDSSSSARHIARYLDWHLEKMEPIPAYESFDLFEPLNSLPNTQVLEYGIDLFRCLQAEDDIKCYYKAGLSRRLLSDHSWDTIEKESYMVKRLQSEYGIKFAGDLDKMIKDIKTSHEQMELYKGYLLEKRIRGDGDMYLNIISGETWSIPWKKEAKLSTEMLVHQRRYLKFYNRKQPRPKLTWMASLGTCILEASYPKCKIKLNTTQYQAMILLLFNDINITQLTMTEIARRLQIDKIDAAKALKQLSKSNTKLLVRRSSKNNGYIIEDAGVVGTDEFSYNSEYTSLQPVVDIQQTTTDLSTIGLKNIVRQELFNKREKVQALIMKALKDHKKLATEEIHRLISSPNKSGYPNFVINDLMVKSELEVLTERHFIHKTDDNLFEYWDE